MSANVRGYEHSREKDSHGFLRIANWWSNKNGKKREKTKNQNMEFPRGGNIFVHFLHSPSSSYGWRYEGLSYTNRLPTPARVRLKRFRSSTASRIRSRYIAFGSLPFSVSGRVKGFLSWCRLHTKRTFQNAQTKFFKSSPADVWSDCFHRTNGHSIPESGSYERTGCTVFFLTLYERESLSRNPFRTQLDRVTK